MSEIKYNIIYVSYLIYKLMDLYISHDKSKRLNIYLFGLFFYTSIRIKERVVNLMIKFGKGVVKHRVLILIVAFALLIPSDISGFAGWNAIWMYIFSARVNCLR